MRTNRQHETTWRDTMIAQIKASAARCETLLSDAIGVASLVVMLIGGLYLPGLF